MPEILQPDICIIGAGPGGLFVAAAAATFGVPVVLIEKGRIGGDRLNGGSVPANALIAAAARAQAAREAIRFGIAAEPKIDFGAVHDHVQRVIQSIAPNNSRERFVALGVRVIDAEVRFTGPETVTADNFEIKARRFVIATGSTPAIPGIPGLDRVPYRTNETIFALRECPKRLIIIGAGATGLELAQAFRRLGAAVTVLDAARPLGREDPECAAIVLDALAREGVAIHANAQIVRIARSRGGLKVNIKLGDATRTIEGDELLVAAGRSPSLESLDLEKAGIAFDARGITVDKGLRTSNKRVYAIGDCVGGPQFTHAANYQAGLVIKNALFRLPVRADNTLISRVIFTDPEFAQAGLTEDEARAGHRTIRVLRWPFHDNDRAQAERDTQGHIKVVATRSGRILGATIVGAGAGELIGMFALGVAQGMNVRAVAGLVLPYPTRAEAGKHAAVEFFARNLTRPALRRIIALLRLLG